MKNEKVFSLTLFSWIKPHEGLDGREINDIHWNSNFAGISYKMISRIKIGKYWPAFLQSNGGKLLTKFTGMHAMYMV